MFSFLFKIFDPSGFPPRWQCGTAWSVDPWLGWLHICSDAVTFAAYYAVPCVVMYFVLRRRDVRFPPVFYVFLGLVFLSCGTVHLIEAAIFWWAAYRLSAVMKLLTAVVSGSGVLMLVRVLPRALDLKSPEGIAAVRAISARSDVVIENFRVGVADKPEGGWPWSGPTWYVRHSSHWNPGRPNRYRKTRRGLRRPRA